MAIRDTEKSQEITQWFQSWDEYAIFADYCIRRFKATDGRPILKAEQLDCMNLRREEAAVVQSIYNRFSPQIRPSRHPQS